MSVAYFRFKHREPEGGYIKPNQIKLLKYNFHKWHSIVSKWHLVSFRVPIVCPFHCIFHIDECRSGKAARSVDDSQAS